MECCARATSIIVSKMWKVPFDIFQNVVKYNLNFPHCGSYNPQCEKNILRFSTKLEVKSFMFHNVQSKSNKNSTHNAGFGQFSNKTSTIEWFKDFCGRNVDSVHNVDIT